jgi:hypothetical protein
MNMQQTRKTNDRRMIAAQNAAIVRRNMPQVTYSVDHPARHEALQAVLAGLRPTPISEASWLPDEAILARLCQQNRWDGLQAGLWDHRHLLALVSNADELDADTLDAKYREMTAAVASSGSIAEIRATLNVG